MWLEINGQVIIGIHSDKCENENTWVDHDGDADVGDQWVEKKVIKCADSIDDLDSRRVIAQSEILKRYPIWKQLNILRKNDWQEVTDMGKFIDAVRNWSNDLNISKDQIQTITQ